MKRSWLLLLMLFAVCGVACAAPDGDDAAQSEAGRGEDPTIQVFRSPT